MDNKKNEKLKSDQLKIFTFAGVFILAIILSFISLFKSINYEQKIYALTNQLHILRMQNEIIDTQISHDFKKQNYDQIQQNWKIFSESWESFQRNIALDIQDQPDVLIEITQLQHSIELKYQRILHFESDKAVLANSIFFLLDLTSDIRHHPSKEMELIADNLGQLLNNIFYYNANQNSLTEEINQLTALIEKNQQFLPLDKALLLGHLEMLSNKNKELTSTIEIIHQQQVAQKFANLELYFTKTIDHERSIHKVVNSLIAMLAMIMLIGFIFTFFKIYRDKTKILSLQQENEQKNHELIVKMQLLNEYKRALDESSIVSKTDLKGVITYANDKFYKISGYNENELIGQSHNIVRHSEFPASVYKELWQTIRSKKVFRGIIQNRTKTGEEYFVDSTIVPILDENNSILEYIAIRNDVTELIRAKDEAISAGKAKSAFLANMSHELRTPLNAIIGFSQILIAKPDTPPLVKSFIEKIHISGKNLLTLVNTILDFSKIEAGEMELYFTDFLLSDLASEIIILTEMQALKKNIAIQTTWGLTPLHADQQLLKQVFLNLLGNAIKFSPKDSLISLNYTADDDCHIISVCDQGPGISSDKIETLFQPFTQIREHQSESTKGTGLGLAIVKSIVALHGGTIHVDSHLNKGSCFQIIIPIIRVIA